MAKGDTAMKHARAVIAEEWAHCPVEFAKQSAVTRGGRTFSLGEDLFGVFDSLILDQDGFAIGIQVTTQPAQGQGGGGPAARKKKLREWAVRWYGRPDSAPFTILLWAWVQGSHFREWAYEWDLGKWTEMAPVHSPLIKSAPPSAPA